SMTRSFRGSSWWHSTFAVLVFLRLFSFLPVFRVVLVIVFPFYCESAHTESNGKASRGRLHTVCSSPSSSASTFGCHRLVRRQAEDLQKVSAGEGGDVRILCRFHILLEKSSLLS